MSFIESNRQTSNLLLALIDLAHRARSASGLPELGFLLVNDTRSLLEYRQAALWFRHSGIYTLSGVTRVDRTTPYAQWLHRTCSAISDKFPEITSPILLSASDLGQEVAEEWDAWIPSCVLWLPIRGSASDSSPLDGGLLIAGDKEFAPDLFPVLQEWIEIWRFVWVAQDNVRSKPFRSGFQHLRDWLRATDGLRWWRQRRFLALIGSAALLLVPVRQTVLAPGELIPASPTIIRAPVDGVIGEFHIAPNQVVKNGDPLFSFDEAPIASRLDVARQSLATAETEYRQLAQLALNDNRSKGQLAALVGRIGEKRAEAEYIESQFSRAKVTSSQDGVALIDDPMEWIGRPVQTGERVMRVANPDLKEIEAWIPIGDAIPLPENAATSLYLSATPFSPVSGTVYYVGHDAVARPDGSFAYRIRARLDNPVTHRVGLKGTAKISGGWVPLAYWILRRPLATLRQWIAL